MHPASESSISTEERMDFDEIAWDRNGHVFSAWKEKLLNENMLTEIGSWIIKYRGGSAGELLRPNGGAFNIVFRMKFPDNGSAIMRFPKPGFCVFPEEKVQREVAVMRFVERHTSIRVPHVFHYGRTEQSPAGLGPFIIMEYIESDSNLVNTLNTPSLSDDNRPILDPNIPEDRLRSVYSEMAEILLELAKHSFKEIGSISNNESDEFDDEWRVTHRPLTMNMNRLVQLGNFPPHLLPQHTFQSASEYFLALAEMHMNHLSMRSNGAIVSAEDCRQKYIARCLFRKLARENRLCRYDNGPFKLFCDDLRPANILADSKHNFSIVGAIDWEFSYVAPAEFVYSPPPWLILERPECWLQGLDDWTRVYEQHLAIFLQELQKREHVIIKRGILAEDNRLSERMKESWENGDFWVNYAARRSWAFDMVYWAKIDQQF